MKILILLAACAFIGGECFRKSPLSLSRQDSPKSVDDTAPLHDPSSSLEPEPTDFEEEESTRRSETGVLESWLRPFLSKESRVLSFLKLLCPNVF